MNYEIIGELQNTFILVLHVLLQNKVRNKAIVCCEINEMINSRDSVYWAPGF